MYIVFWKKGNKSPDLEFRPTAYCNKCEKDIKAIQVWKNPQKQWGKYRQQYLYRCPHDGTIVEPYYYAAFNCIDWSDLGTRIGDRAKPLSDNTIRRIKHGLEKHGHERLVISNYTPGNSKPVSDSLGAVTTVDHHALLTPMILHSKYGKEARGVIRPVTQQSFTQTTFESQAILTPFVVKGEHTQKEGYTKSLGGVIQTQTVRQSMALVTPMLVEMNRTGKTKRLSEATSTFTSGGVNHSMVSMPVVVENKGQSNSKSAMNACGTLTTEPHLGIVTDESWNSFIHYNYGKDTISHTKDPLGTATTRDRHSVISFKKPVLEDCYYRMLRASEIKLAMAFEKDYIVLGNQRDQVKQLGNAVTPPAMEWLIGQIVQSLM